MRLLKALLLLAPSLIVLGLTLIDHTFPCRAITWLLR